MDTGTAIMAGILVFTDKSPSFNDNDKGCSVIFSIIYLWKLLSEYRLSSILIRCEKEKLLLAVVACKN